MTPPAVRSIRTVTLIVGYALLIVALFFLSAGSSGVFVYQGF
jgi:hypothetical protein